MENSVSTTAEPIRHKKSSAEEAFDPTDGLVGILWRAIANNEDVLVTLRNSEGIVLVPSSRTYIKFTNDMRAFCEADAQDYTVKCLDAGYKKQFEQRKKLGRCMSELLWTAAHYSSKGRLIAGCGRYDVVKLKRWPNLTRVPSTPAAMKIAALLSRYPTHVALAKNLTGASYEELNEFCSAAFAARYLEILSQTETWPEPMLRPHRDRSVLRQVFNRLLSK